MTFDTTPDGIEHCIDAGESSCVKFMTRAFDEHAIARVLLEFAYGDGGILLIGIGDDGEIVGLPPTGAGRQIERLRRIARSGAFIPYPIDVGVVDVRGRTVVYAITERAPEDTRSEINRTRALLNVPDNGPEERFILELLESTLQMYEVMGARGDALYGQALAHALFTLNQRVKPVGVLGTLTGRVARFKERALLEMFPFTRIREEDIPSALSHYARWCLDLGGYVNLMWLQRVLEEAVARIPKDRRAALRDDAQRAGLAWLSLIDEAAWSAPYDAEQLTLAGDPIR